MVFERFSMALIIPFEYKAENFTKLCLGQVEEVLEHFQPERLRLDMVDATRMSLFWGNEQSILKCYSLRKEYVSRKKLGLQKADYIYTVTKKEKEYPLKLKEVKVWMFDSGKAYLSITVETQQMAEANVLELKKILTDIKVNYPIVAKHRVGKEEIAEEIFSIKSVTGAVIECLQSIGAKASIGETNDKAYTLTYALVDELEEERLDELTELICLNRTKSMKACVNMQSGCRHDSVYEYIVWMMSKKSLAIVADCAKADENVAFLRSGLKGSVMNNYLWMYLYYLNLAAESKYIKNYCDQIKQNKRKNLEEKMVERLSSLDYYMQPMMKESHQHLNYLFLDCLCDKTWNLKQEISLLHNEYLKWAIEYQEYNIFISYRREGGFYLARLLQELLSKRKVFLDTERLKAGKFDEAIYKAIEQCENVIVILSPDCFKRCKDPEDYVRKEIMYAMKLGKNIIPVMMNGFTFPEVMPEGLEDFPLHNGIHCAPHIFRDYTVKNILEYLK